MSKRPPHLIKVIGISAAGKSTLVSALRQLGFNARAVSQEHSSVPGLWQQFEKPDVLIFLDLTLSGQRERRPDVSWSESWYQTELDRLHNARSHADLRIDTTGQSPEEILRVAQIWLEHNQIRRASAPLPSQNETGGARKGPAEEE